MKGDLLKRLMAEINGQLEQQNLKISNANVAVVDASSDEEGYIEGIHVTPANAHESRHLTPLLDDLPEGVELLADKGYVSKANRAELDKRGLKDGIMHKAVRGARSHQISNGVTTK